MFKLKNFFISFIFVLFIISTVFAQSEVVTKDPSGVYIYETTISSLVDRRTFEEIKLINNSSLALTHVTCTITINGRNHDMRPMPVLKLGDSEGFDGYFEDDMNREFPKYFGKDGKFSRRNNNIVRFTFNFRGHNDDVAITDVYDGEEDLCFVVNDAIDVPSRNNTYVTEQSVVSAPTQTPAPVQTVNQPVQKAQTQQVQNQPSSNNGDTTVVIGGKSYLIHDGKAYPIQ